MKIYTKTGDRGETSLFGGKRVSKADLRVEAYGTVDELNSAIGVVIAEAQSAKRKAQNYISKLKTELTNIQSDLFAIGSELANPTKTYNSSSLSGLRAEGLKPTTLDKRVKDFETMIDDMTGQLSQLRNFILPGGGTAGSQLHFARTLARRAERRIVELAQKGSIDTSILVYFNRLSDLLFTMARFVNYKEKQKETIWNSSKV